jgi:3-phenylpropionate/trans-cinnamate dioxygenase ferredoxin subunit
MVYNWYKIENITASVLQQNVMREFIVNEKHVGLLKRGDNIYAFSSICPHAGGNLCEGWLDARGRIICPVHNYRFDPATGRNTSGEGYKLFTYPVEVRNNDIYVGLLT